VNEPKPIQAGDVLDAKRLKLRRRLLLVVPVVLVAIGLYYFLFAGRYESTDDASLQAGQVSITASISGKVIAIAVHENQIVKAGDILFHINPDVFQAAVDEASAQLAAARTDIGTLQASYKQAEADLQAAQARLTYAEREAARKKSLLGRGFSPHSQYDEALMAAQTARRSVDAAEAKREAVRASLSGDVDAPIDTQPAVRRAQAALERARIALDDTVVHAPQDGIVTRVHQLQVGDYVSASRPVFTLIGKRVWVEANFKESQLRNMRRGQSATVTIDAYPHHEFTAHIESFSPGTGNSFSLLPAENATGNWVKVVQRLPVELVLDEMPPDLPLHTGLSVVVTVDTKSHGSDQPVPASPAAPHVAAEP
jgi:membrane fusion protein (multidrug efflux system)